MAATGNSEVKALTPLWEHDLVVPQGGWGAGRIAAVSQGHVLATGSIDSTPGTDSPTPNLSLPYGIADATTGEVVVMDPIGSYPSTAEDVPDTTLEIDAAYVERQLSEIVGDTDLSKYVL